MQVKPWQLVLKLLIEISAVDVSITLFSPYHRCRSLIAEKPHYAVPEPLQVVRDKA
jgi:hypothetical protein